MSSVETTQNRQNLNEDHSGSSSELDDIQELPEIENKMVFSDSSEDEIVEIDTRPLRRVSRFVTFINLTNALLGAGIISMSSTFKSVGLGPTIILLIISCLLCYISGVILLNLQFELHISNIDELANGIFGRPCQILISMLIFIFDLAFTTTYLVIGADSILSWIRCSGAKWTGFGPWAGIIIIYSLFLPIAMTIPRKFLFLDKFQMLTVFLIVFYAIAIIVKGFAASEVPDPSVVGTTYSMSMFTSFSVHCLTFCLPIHMLPVISPYNPNQLKRQTIMASSLVFCFIVIVAPGIVGYLIMGENTRSNLLSSFPDNDTLFIVVRIAIFLVVTFSYPVITNEMAGTLGGFLYHNSEPSEMTLKQRCILLPLVNAISLIFALLSNNMLPILGLGGALGTCLVTFAFPSICRLKITHSKLSSPRNIAHMCFAGFGIIMACICVYTSAADLIKAYKEGTIKNH
ncbi:Transmembrane amino acid transporter protein [Tritrichomonas foetus]|uniref:Transmembrane amino acid transporter protein n=1 Tax=Tritrichomonas foetus TaxID=1144522 RepID=A0A1J4K4C7_9EUKA|nr:Transmembrane amino acid transporter protein [Tritrichomonas foetus]|eukprot:OHT06239.1 Transmembrane amino acid transporter protein [Tritrichomonas foetus]